MTELIKQFSAMKRGARKAKVVVRNVPPHLIEAQYRNALYGLLNNIDGQFRKVVTPELRKEIWLRDHRQDSIGDVLELIKGLFAITVPGAQMAFEFANKVFKWNAQKFARPISEKMGIAVQLPEGGSAEMLRAWSITNETEIKQLQDDHINRMLRIVQRGWEDGLSHKAIADQLVKEAGTARNYAKFVARDQIGNLNGTLTRMRNEQLGVSEFVWRTSEDERVRGDPSGRYPKAKPSHFKHANKTFSWAEGTGGSRDKFPGADYQCRCYAESVIEF